MTIRAMWAAITDVDRLDDLVAWPPDVFALVDRVLVTSESYRFVVSPPRGVELTRPGQPDTIASDWWRWLEGERATPPDGVLRDWKMLCDHVDVHIEDLAVGGEWELIEALLRLYAIADEACAGLGSATAARPGAGCLFRARARELLAHTGSLSRIASETLRVLPRCRTSVGGVSVRSLSRHVFVAGPQVDVEWHRMLSRPTGVTYPEAHANIVLLPWPMRVRARDFKPVRYALPQMDSTTSGFFEFDPLEPLDLDLVDRVLASAVDEGGTVDVLFLPETAITPEEVEPLEALAGDYGVWCLIAGVREPSADGRLGGNYVHVGIRQEMVWRHTTQHKHHRWRLDGRQLQQYHLGGALSPTMRWWEAIEVPRRSLQVIDQGAVTLVPLLCEDLARLEPVAELVRSIGPALVLTLLLDGPQLASRWTARYASVLADDPGSAVCTLTSYGMVRRSRPPGCDVSNVIGLWKDATGELTEIELANGADAVLMSTAVVVGDCSTADGRGHPASTSSLRLAAVQSLHVRGTELPAQRPSAAPPAGDRSAGALPPLEEREVSKASSWAEAIAEAAAVDGALVDRVLDDAMSNQWRAALALPSPTRLFADSTDALRRALPRRPTIDEVLSATRRLRRSAESASVVTGALVEIALEQRLFTEVQAGRLPPQVLDQLGDRTTDIEPRRVPRRRTPPTTAWSSSRSCR